MAALEQAEAKAFDLIFVDLGAPHVARLQVCRTLRQHTLNRHAPIVIIASSNAFAAALTEIENGADDFLMKPFGPGELAARARAAIHRSRASRLVQNGAAGRPRPRRRHPWRHPGGSGPASCAGSEPAGQSDGTGVQPVVCPGRARRRRLQPRRPADADLGQRSLRHRAKRRHARQPASPAHRAGRAATIRDIFTPFEASVTNWETLEMKRLTAVGLGAGAGGRGGVRRRRQLRDHPHTVGHGSHGHLHGTVALPVAGVACRHS